MIGHATRWLEVNFQPDKTFLATTQSFDVNSGTAPASNKSYKWLKDGVYR